MNFDDRLKRAIQRGVKDKDERTRAEVEEKLSLDQLRTMHSGFRLELSEHVEECMKRLVDHLPGFEYQTVLGEDGWGGRLTRDDIHLVPGKSPESRYSRFEMTVSPFTPTAIVELVTKGTVRNREIMNRKNYQKVDDFDVESFREMIDLRVLEFAEQYSKTE
ncbi:hypothetical protein [Thalassoglobus polymorphus]|uniref:Uncharacterized protein n=1 Tax=Thalassoglobus polymorphus TaxID=2527994 RepID=A0A517QT64_9PLAN|nr:hypothetical protein [Thalassoglobus polymorphus]QDT34833.1 hypothetical protein Mal48_41060 [Thalassoglobus polymorphus]